MPELILPTLTALRSSDLLPQIRKDQLRTGDWVIIRTARSEYRLRILANALVEARGGWFDKNGFAPMLIGVAGATWGGSAIMPNVLAACGLCVEFGNRLVTSPVRSITIFRNSSLH